MKLQHSIVIARPLSEVFAFVSDHDKMPGWISTLERSTLAAPGPVAVGTQFQQEHTERGKRIVFEGKVTKLEAPSQLTFELKNDDATVTLSYHLTEQGAGTQLEQTSEVKLHNMMLRMVAGAFEGTVRERMATDFESLRTQIESGQ